MKKLLIFCVALVLAGCSGATSTPTANPAPSGTIPTSVPEASPLAVTTPAPGQPTEVTDSAGGTAEPATQKKFSDQAFPFTFVYPVTWTLLERAPDAPTGVTLRGPAVGEGPEPIIFAITVEVQPAKGQTVKGVVDEQLAQVPKAQQANIKRTQVKVGDLEGEQVIGLPSRSGAIETFVENEDQVFLIMLQPYDPSNGQLARYLIDARSVYDYIIATWQWTR